MTALARDRATPYREGVEIDYLVKGSTKIYDGSLVCVTGAGGYAIPAADAAGNIFVGMALRYVDNSAGADGAKTVRVRRMGVFEFNASSITQAMVGDLMYVVDDQTFDETSPGNSIPCGVLVKYVSATKGWIDIAQGVRIGAAIAATAISIADAGGYFAANNAETVLQEVGAEMAVYNKGVIQPSVMTLEDGTALTTYTADPTPGWAQLANKELVLKWGSHATPGKIAAKFLLPDDIDETADVVVHALVAMSAANDTPELTHEAYIGKGDTDCAGADPEVTGGIALTEYTMTIAAADVPAGPAPLSIILNPKDGELGTDDLYLYDLWVEYTKKTAV